MSGVAKIPGLLVKSMEKLVKLGEIMRANGGLRGSFYKLLMMDSLKEGKLVGEDKYGNRYFSNPRYFYGTNRWVEYAEHQRLDYDGSQIPAEWFGWMHYKTDLLPKEEPARPSYPWMTDHTPNATGTRWAYCPYPTTRPKIHAWNPSH